MKVSEVSVCVLQAKEIEVVFNGIYAAKGIELNGLQHIEYRDGNVFWNDNHYQELVFMPNKKDNSFSIKNVIIGINFHWQRYETQTFKGVLKLIANDGNVCAINVLPIEQYLISVISSEMKATSSLELLKAHAVISRSWLMAQKKKRKNADNISQNAFMSFVKNDNRLIRWYDRQDHTLFDVCADDHCQRYQGITRADNQTVVEAVLQTKGQVLKYGNDICDARFSKCCGGMMELFSTCWQDEDFPYLVAKPDLINGYNQRAKIDLTIENNAQNWIETYPEAFCNTKDERILKQVLNNYDQETTDFYRWHIKYSQKDIRDLIEEKTKMNLGDIIKLKPIKRGPSGRIYILEIVGSEKSFIIGKELEIRRTLSKSHLYSSAFTVKELFNKDNLVHRVPDFFILYGAGWGHGVGLCQIGAAVMADKGFDYQNILMHYYPNSCLEKIY